MGVKQIVWHLFSCSYKSLLIYEDIRDRIYLYGYCNVLQYFLIVKLERTNNMAKSLNPRPVSGVNPRPVGRMNQRPTTHVVPHHASQTTSTTAPVHKDVVPKVAKSVSSQVSKTPQGNSSMNQVDQLVAMMRNMVGGFAILDDKVIEQNLRLASGDGMSMEDRTLSFECVDYIMSNMGLIFMGLVLDENFKDAFVEALSVELNIDQQTPDVKAKAREDMKDKTPYKSAGSICLGVTSFSPAITDDLMNKLNKSFDMLDPFAAEFDEEASKLTQEQKIELGFIFSNFMYLIRAFAQNDMFTAYVITVIERVKEITFK